MEHPVDENNYPLFDGLDGLKQKPMKTAIEWYIDEMQKFEKGTSEYFSSAAILNHAFRMEKEHIIDAFDAGFNEANSIYQNTFSLDYYNQNYNQNK